MAGVVRELCEEFNAVCVPFDSLFEKLVGSEPEPSYWIWDGIHPTPAGHRRMADLWKKKVRIR
jgi:lysophospholipase L1-like esterase